METKSKILNLLKKKEMTITELSNELDLSTATVSQHMEELQRMGAIEKIDNEHFRKLKYYRATTMATPILAKYAVAVIVVLALLSGVYLYSSNFFGSSVLGSTAPTSTHASISQISTGNSNNTTTIGSTGPSSGMFACPMLFYNINGSITSYSGEKVYYLNSSQGTIADYVMPNGTTATFNVTESINHVLTEPSGFNLTRQHYAGLASVNNNMYITGIGINVTVVPVNFTIVNNTKSSFTVTLAANGTAQGTYWLRIDYPCGGGVAPVLITIGSMPYNGTLNTSTQIYS